MFSVEFKMIGGETEYAVVNQKVMVDDEVVAEYRLAVTVSEDDITIQNVESSDYICVKNCPDWFFNEICDALEAEGFKGVSA